MTRINRQQLAVRLTSPQAIVAIVRRCVGIASHAPPPDGNSTVFPPSQPCTTVMRFSVSVPVLSEQMSVALPIVSHAASTRIRFWSFNIFRVEYASEMVTASG